MGQRDAVCPARCRRQFAMGDGVNVAYVTLHFGNKTKIKALDPGLRIVTAFATKRTSPNIHRRHSLVNKAS